MPDHNRTTIETYDAVAERYLEIRRDGSFEASWLRSFVEALPRGATVLDLGAGPGRDAARLREFGFHPVCLDRSIGMLRAGASEYPNPRVQGDALQLPLASSSIAGVWANASLLHFSPEDFECAIVEIRRVLVSAGRFYLSMKKGQGADWETRRYGERRWFQYWSGVELDRVLESAGYRIEKVDEERTSDDTWLVRECVAVR